MLFTSFLYYGSCCIALNTPCGNLGKDKLHSLATFMPLLDVTVLWKDKESAAREAWNSFHKVNDVCFCNINNPYDALDLKIPHLYMLEYFTAILYDRTGTLESVDEVHQVLFLQNSKSLQNMPPTMVHD